MLRQSLQATLPGRALANRRAAPQELAWGTPMRQGAASPPPSVAGRKRDSTNKAPCLSSFSRGKEQLEYRRWNTLALGGENGAVAKAGPTSSSHVAGGKQQQLGNVEAKTDALPPHFPASSEAEAVPSVLHHTINSVTETDQSDFEDDVTSTGYTLVSRTDPSLGNSRNKLDPSDSNADVVLTTTEASAVDMEAVAKGAGKSTGSGLRRSPSSGGVQSATQAHGLPDPHVAVRNLVAQSKEGHLCTVMSRMHHRRAGYPFASLIEFAIDEGGHPIFSLSPLSFHARNLLADPRCTLVVQIPGWSGLADARVTFFGEVYPVPEQHQGRANAIFCSRHRQEHSAAWGNSHFFRMEVITDIHFVGGFGTVSWIDTWQYMSVLPDKIASEDSERTLEVLNSRLGSKLKGSLASLVKTGAPTVEEVKFIAVDGKGVDLRVQQGGQAHVRRLSFGTKHPVEDVDEAMAALEDILVRAALPLDLVDQQH